MSPEVTPRWWDLRDSPPSCLALPALSARYTGQDSLPDLSGHICTSLCPQDDTFYPRSLKSRECAPHHTLTSGPQRCPRGPRHHHGSHGYHEVADRFGAPTSCLGALPTGNQPGAGTEGDSPAWQSANSVNPTALWAWTPPPCKLVRSNWARPLRPPRLPMPCCGDNSEKQAFPAHTTDGQTHTRVEQGTDPGQKT